MQLTHSQKLSSDLKNILNKMDFVGVELYSNRSIYFWSKDRLDRFSNTLIIDIDSFINESMLLVSIHTSTLCEDNSIYEVHSQLSMLEVNEICGLINCIKDTIDYE